MHSEKLVIVMSNIDTYGLSSEQYEEFFEDNVEFAAKLYVKACQILKDNGAGAIVLAEIQSVNAKVEALADYLAELVKVTTKGLNGIAENLVD